MKPRSILAVLLLVFVTSAIEAAAQTPPPAPALLEPASGAALVQPMMLRWSAVTDPDGPIESYIWQVGTTSGFTLVIASGFTDVRHGDPVPTQDRVSGLPNGTYFWRVRATQTVGGATGFIESAWSAVRSFTITGLGPAPGGTAGITSPATGSRFHAFETYRITWNEVPGAHYYVLEADDQPNFSYPLVFSTSVMEFGTSVGAGWGNEIPNIYYRIRPVSVDNVRGLPSPAVNVRITNAAPVPPAPTPLSPAGGATVALPFTFDWTDTANPQIQGYDLDVDDEPTFGGTFGVLLVQDISRSDYMLVSDLPPGTYFWRVRAVHGAVRGPWSAGASFRVVASPPTPIDLFWLLAQPSSVSGGHSTQARVTLSAPAPPGGAVVKIASDLPHAEVPESVFIPAGATDATVSPITTVPVSGAVVGTLRAAYGAGNWEQSSLGLFPLLFSLSLNKDIAIGGTSVTGTVTLMQPAPPGGIEVTLVSSDTSLARPPAKVLVPEGDTAASFAITTAAVGSAVPIIFNTGTANDNYRAPETRLTLVPVGSPAPSPSLAAVTLQTDSVVGGGTTTGTITLTAPAPPGGARVWVNGSMEGQVVTPSGGVTVPAGSTSANFTITAPQVNAPYWVMIQASYGSGAGMHGAVLRIDPGQPAIPDLHAMGINPPQMSVIAGGSLRGTVGLVTPAPPGGTTVTLFSGDPSVVQVPAGVHIAAGNSAASFTITTQLREQLQLGADQRAVRIGDQDRVDHSLPGSERRYGARHLDDEPQQRDRRHLNQRDAGAHGIGAVGRRRGDALEQQSGRRAGACQRHRAGGANLQDLHRHHINGGRGDAGHHHGHVSRQQPVGNRHGPRQRGGGGGTTGFRSPGANAADSGGDGNGFETNAANAHGDDTSSAVDTNSGTGSSTSCTSTARDKHRFFNYGITVPAGAAVKGIEVRLDARVDSTSGSPRMCVALSWDGGVSWTAAQATSTLTTSMTARTLGGATNTWGRSWTAAELSNANFRVRVSTVADSTSRDFSLDWVAVRVSH